MKPNKLLKIDNEIRVTKGRVSKNQIKMKQIILTAIDSNKFKP